MPLPLPPKPPPCPTHKNVAIPRTPGCDYCAARRRWYSADWYRRKKDGTWRHRRVEATEAHARLRELVGVYHKTLVWCAQRSGLGLTTVQTIHGGETHLKWSPTIRRDTHDAIMGITLREGGDGFLNSVGTTRRLRAMAAEGMSANWIAGQLGLSRLTVNRLRAGGQPYVTRVTRDAIAELYDSIAGSLPDYHSPKNVTLARANRWVSSAHWQGVDIDDPTAKPLTAAQLRTMARQTLDLILVERFVAGEDVELTNKAERREALIRLRASGKYSNKAVRERLRLSHGYIKELLAEVDDGGSKALAA